MIPIYDLQKKSKEFKLTQEAEKAFKEIKELLISPLVLRVPTPKGLFQLESGTSCEGVRGTLFQKQGDEWVVIGYHSKRLPTSVKKFGVTELELTRLLVNIHGFMQLLHNHYFEVLVDNKAVEYIVKSKKETSTTRLGGATIREGAISRENMVNVFAKYCHSKIFLKGVLQCTQMMQ